MAAEKHRFNYWRGSDMGIERIYVRDGPDEYGYFERDPWNKGVSWSGADGGSVEVLDALFGTKRIGPHASWRMASEEGDTAVIWRALLYLAGAGR